MTSLSLVGVAVKGIGCASGLVTDPRPGGAREALLLEKPDAHSLGGGTSPRLVWCHDRHGSSVSERLQT